MFDWLWKRLVLKPPAPNPAEDFREFDIPENREILTSCDYFGLTGNPYASGSLVGIGHVVGTHPDLVDYLWEEVASELPPNVRWIVRGTAVLVHPESKIIFAYCGGTHTIMFRVPDEAAGGLAASWTERTWNREADALHARRAYDFASARGTRLTTLPI